MLQIWSDEQQCENLSFTASYPLTVYFKCMKNYAEYDQKKYSDIYYLIPFNLPLANDPNTQMLVRMKKAGKVWGHLWIDLCPPEDSVLSKVVTSPWPHQITRTGKQKVTTCNGWVKAIFFILFYLSDNSTMWKHDHVCPLYFYVIEICALQEAKKAKMWHCHNWFGTWGSCTFQGKNIG